MPPRLFAFIPALAQPAAGFVLPNGNVVWELSAGDFDVRIEQFNDSELGLMSFMNRDTGETQLGDLSSGFVYDRDGAQNFPDEAFARGVFGTTLVVTVEMLDQDGVVFDGVIVEPKYPAALLTPSPPPLALFESATLTLTPIPGDPLTLPIDRLPEPGLAPLFLPLLGYLAARAFAILS